MSGASEHAAQIVPEPSSSQERDWITDTAFWSHLWRDFPNLAKELRDLVRRRRVSGRIKPGQPWVWIVGAGGLQVRPGQGRGTLDEFPHVLDPHMARGRVQLAIVEWDSDPPTEWNIDTSRLRGR